MSRHSLQIRSLLPAVVMILNAAVFGVAQQPPANKHNVRPDAPTSPSAAKSVAPETTPVRYSYEFVHPEFVIRHITIEHNSKGAGKIVFERLNEEIAFTEELEISPEVAARIHELWQSLRFLESNADYQSDRQYPHLGIMRLKMEEGSRHRTAEFNWTTNKFASLLVDEYRRIADQAVIVFDISIARANQPLNTPKLMEVIESMLKRNALSDPRQLLPLLKELTTDEHIPLMARNHAQRLIKKIEK